MPSRRPHIKSRHGCAQCKARRIKCDETRPICASCAQRDISCSFGESSSSLIFISGPNSRATRLVESGRASRSSTSESKAQPNLSSTPSTATKPNNAGLAPPPSTSFSVDAGLIHRPGSINALELENLRLMCHYFTHAWLTIVSDTEGELKDTHHSLWHGLVPDMAMKHDYLLHALLALSATHLAITTPASSTTPSELTSTANVARHHQALTLALLRKELECPISIDNIQPLFACSTLVSLYAFGNFLMPGAETGADVIEEFRQAITILNGIGSIVQCDPSLLKGTPFKIAVLPTPRDPSGPLSPATEEFIAALNAANAVMAWPQGVADTEGYSFMIGVLRYTFRLHCEMPERQMKAIPFAMMLPECVLSGIRERRGLALCLIAGYATVLYTLKDNIWIQDWGMRVIKSVEKTLAGTEWEELSAWALRMTSKDPLEL